MNRGRRLIGVFLVLLMTTAVGCGDPLPEIVKAVQGSSAKKVAELIDGGIDVNFTHGSHGDTLLHLACRRGRAQIVEVLIQKNADLDRKNDDGDTGWDLLWNHSSKASMGERGSNCLGLLLRGGFKPLVKAGEDGKSFLHVAAARCDSENLMLMLIEKLGEQFSALDDNGWTPLHWAVFKGKYESSKGLIAAGADVNAETTKTIKELGAKSHGGKHRIRSLYNAGSRPLDLDLRGHQRFAKDLEGLLREAGATNNTAIKNHSWTR